MIHFCFLIFFFKLLNLHFFSERTTKKKRHNAITRKNIREKKKSLNPNKRNLIRKERFDAWKIQTKLMMVKWKRQRKKKNNSKNGIFVVRI